MKNIVKDLREQYNFNLDVVLELYEKGESLQSIADKEFNKSFMNARIVLSLLGLRLKRKHRLHDLSILKTRLIDSKNSIEQELQNTYEQLEYTAQELYKKEKTIRRLQLQNNSLRATTRRALDNQSTYKEFVNELTNIPKVNCSPIKIDIDSSTEEYRTNTHIMVLSDMHFNSLINHDDVQGQEEYNFKIAESRVDKVIEACILQKETASNLVIANLADEIEGIIHNGDLTGEISTAESVVQLASILSSKIISLSKAYTTVKYLHVSSNHPRFTDTPATRKKKYDFSYILTHLIKEMCKDYTNVYVDIETDVYKSIPIGDKYIGMFHGDTVRGYNATVKSSVIKVESIFENIFGSKPLHLISGHTHSFKVGTTSSNGMAITSGSMVGVNEYVHASGFIPEAPSQVVMCVNSKCDIISMRRVTFK
jgi:hypothetical protein